MSSDTLIREVDEELRRDRLRKAWRQGGPWVIGAAVAVVVGFAAYYAWTGWEKSQSDKSSDQFYAAIDATNGKDLTAAKTALDGVIASGWSGYPMLAKFREAALLAQQGQPDQAVAAYDALSTSLDDVHLRELALVLAANILVDKGDVAAVQQRVGGLITPTDPLRNAAREALGLAQYKAGKLDDAMATFQAILSDGPLPQDEQQRIQIYTRQLLAAGAKAPAAASAAPPAVTTDASAAKPSEAAAMMTSAVQAIMDASASAASAAASDVASAPSTSMAPAASSTP